MIKTTVARYLEYMIQEFHNGLISLKESYAPDDEELETIYALGYNLFTCCRYLDAKDIFIGLTAYAPYTSHYWRALGAVNQQIKNCPEAIAAYDMAIANDETDIVSYVYRAESQILSGNINKGIKDLQDAIDLGISYPQHFAWMNRAQFLLNIHKQT